MHLFNYFILFYRDDLCYALFNNIYPYLYIPYLYLYHNDINLDELELKKENEDPCKASFRKLSIKVHDRKLIAVPFYTNGMPYFDSNVLSETFYIWNLQSARKFYVSPGQHAATDLINMLTSDNILLERMKKQGGELTRIIWSLKKIFRKQLKAVLKFADSLINLTVFIM